MHSKSMLTIRKHYYSFTTLSLVPGVIMMLTFYLLHLLMVSQIVKSRTDKALTYKHKFGMVSLSITFRQNELPESFADRTELHLHLRFYSSQ